MWRRELWLFLAFPACGDPCADLSTTVPLTDASGYTYDGTLDIAGLPLADATDATITWDGLTVDLQGHPLDPATDIVAVWIVNFRYLTEAEVEDGLGNDDIDQSEVGLFAFAETGGATSVQLSDLSVLSYPFDPTQYFQSSYGTWLLLLTGSTSPGQDTRMAAFLEPSPEQSAISAAITDDCTLLTVNADLSSLTPVPVLSDTPDLVADWSGLTLDARKRPLDTRSIDGVMVARYDGLTVSDIEADFLDVELMADALWYGDATGDPSLALSILEGEEGAFPGVSDDALWLLALTCGTCANPAPVYLTVLEGCGG